MAPSASVSRESVLSARVMGSRAYVSFSVACFVALEVVKPFRPAPWQRSVVSMMWVKAVVHMPVKA
jgi:hypothetical protein